MSENTSETDITSGTGTGKRTAAGSVSTNGHRNGHDPFAAKAHAPGAPTEPPTEDDAAPKVDADGNMPGDPDYNPFNKVSTNEKHRERQEVAAVTEKRLKRFGSRQFDAAVLDGIPEGWARKQAARIAATDAARDPAKSAPTLMFSGAEAVKAGATDAQINALTALSPDGIGALKYRAAALLDDQRAQIRDMARNIAAERQAAACEDTPTRVDMADYTPSDTPWVVEGVVPVGKSIGLFAERKAGKTTVVVELVRALLAGGKFLGRFSTYLPADAEVVVLDTEMGAEMMYDEFVKAGMDRDTRRRISYHDLSGRSAMLDTRNAAMRAHWREQIKPGSFIIIDCLYTVLSALGIDENSSQVADIIESYKTLSVECDAAGRVIVHHLGKDPGKGARGHSSIEGAVDTIANVRLDGPLDTDTPRTFSALGRRGVNVPPGSLTLTTVDDGHRRLTMSGHSPQADRRKARDHGDDDILWRLIHDHPGLSESKLSALPTETRELPRARLRGAMDRLSTLGHITNRGTGTRPAWHAADRDGDPFSDPAALPAADPADPADPAV